MAKLILSSFTYWPKPSEFARIKFRSNQAKPLGLKLLKSKTRQTPKGLGYDGDLVISTSLRGLLAKPAQEAKRMEWIDKLLEKIREWVERVVDALLSPGSEPQPQPIPIPVDDIPRRR
jgi:hypothetical protein